MTDNEIIKALKQRKNAYIIDINKELKTISIGDVLDLINRLQAENERLKKDSKDIDDFARNICKERLLQGKAIADFDSLRRYIKTQKAEAYKEFAEKLNLVMRDRYLFEDKRCSMFITPEDIKQALRELVGDTDA